MKSKEGGRETEREAETGPALVGRKCGVMLQECWRGGLLA